MQVFLVYAYSYEGCSIKGVYSTQELADAQIRRFVTLENALDTALNEEFRNSDPARLSQYHETDGNPLTFSDGFDGITSMMMTIDAPMALDVPPWLNNVPEGVILTPNG